MGDVTVRHACPWETRRFHFFHVEKHLVAQYDTLARVHPYGRLISPDKGVVFRILEHCSFAPSFFIFSFPKTIQILFPPAPSASYLLCLYPSSLITITTHTCEKWHHNTRPTIPLPSSTPTNPPYRPSAHSPLSSHLRFRHYLPWPPPASPTPSPPPP